MNMVPGECVPPTVQVQWYNSVQLEGGALELVKQLLAHKTNYVGMTLDDVREEVAKGDLRIFHVEDQGLDAWFATKVVTHARELRELLILGLCGTGVFRHGKKLLGVWLEMAMYNSCQYIWTQTSDKAVARILKKHRFLPLTEAFVFGVPNGARQ